MPPTIPPVLAPYLHRLIATPQSLVTTVLSTSATWLVLRIVSAAIHGLEYSQQANRGLVALSDRQSHVVIVSFVKSFQLWTEFGKKAGIEVPNLISTRKLAYVDGLKGIVSGTVSTNDNTAVLHSHGLHDVLKSALAAKQTLSSKGASDVNTLVVLDGIDFVLASQPEVSEVDLSHFLLSLQETFSSVVVVAASDGPLLHNTDASASPLEINHSNFIRTTGYQSSLIFQLRPLETGTAKDITGVMRISHGGGGGSAILVADDNDNDDDDEISEGEWLYQLKNDGSVRVWRRGE